MTSPALLVLFLAHVCSIFGTASDPTADYDSKLTIQSKMGYHTTHNTRLNRWTNFDKNLDESNSELYVNNDIYVDNSRDDKIKYDEIYVEETEVASNINLNKMNFKLKKEGSLRFFDESKVIRQRRKRETDDEKCAYFRNIENIIQHPHAKKNKTYYKNADCDFVIEAQMNQVIELTFVDEFQIEDHADCKYDYLEIRDGRRGYAKLLGRFCGSTFPSVIQTAGPYAWLKFHSDDTIEYNGFKIQVKFINGVHSQSVPESCYFDEFDKPFGVLNIKAIDEKCTKESHNLDLLWTIKTAENTKIYLNFTMFKLESPNECETNVVEVFGSKTEIDYRLVQYCGSIANPVSTKDEKEDSKGPGNIMHVRVYVAQAAINKTEFKATYVAYRTLNPNNVDEKCTDDEFDCDDNTCIDIHLRCNPDGEAHCRLKTDEDPEKCNPPAANQIGQAHIIVILVIFSLILSAMSFVFLYKCIRKLYQDHKIIKEHIRESCEDRLDTIGSRLTLDAKRLQRDSEPRASLERENRANEMYKRHRDSFSKRKPSSIDSDYIQETHLDIDDEPWRREVDSIPATGDARIERNGRTRRSERERQDRRSERGSEKQAERKSDMSKKEESISRSKRETEEKEKKEIRDVSVGPPDTKDSSCQTRESLFQADAPPSSEGSGTTGTNSRGFSTFGYSGATIVRPSPPATNTSEMTIELLRQVPRQDSVKPQKKIDRRPISTETTRSAPDVIIVSKPIR